MFCFYPQHEFACPNLNHCPHLGGAAFASVVHEANFSDQSREQDSHTIRTLQKTNGKLLSQVVDLQDQLQQAKLELKLERQNKFATNKQKNDSKDPQGTSRNLKIARKIMGKSWGQSIFKTVFNSAQTEFVKLFLLQVSSWEHRQRFWRECLVLSSGSAEWSLK